MNIAALSVLTIWIVWHEWAALPWRSSFIVPYHIWTMRTKAAIAVLLVAWVLGTAGAAYTQEPVSVKPTFESCKRFAGIGTEIFKSRKQN